MIMSDEINEIDVLVTEDEYEKRLKRNEKWEQKWLDNCCPWQKEHANTYLVKYFSRLTENLADRKLRALVPMCGKSRDVKWLADQGVDVSGIELSHDAIETFFEENSISFEHDVDKKAANLAPNGVYIFSHGNITIFACDFLDFQHEKFGGEYDLVWDRGAFVIFPPEERKPYMDKLHGMLRQGGRILMETMDYPQTEPRAPHSITDKDVTDIFAERYYHEVLATFNKETFDQDMRMSRDTEFDSFTYSHHLFTKK